MTEDPLFPYLQVSYFENMVWVDMKFKHYPLIELERAYTSTINKLTREQKQALVCHRTSEHVLVKSHAINFTEKKKVVRGR